jgi:hypothetical protein
MIRQCSSDIGNRTYRPGPDRSVSIPKAGRNGFREIRIPNLIDRVVQRAAVEILQPWIDPTFSRHVFGARPGLSPVSALARAHVLTFGEERFVWVTDDIRQAFDNVPLQRLFDVVKRRLPDDRLNGFLECAACGSDCDRVHGLRQGGPLSSLLLNVYLDHFLDRKWAALDGTVPLLRYVDDLLFLCRSQQEAVDSYNRLHKLILDAGLSLKGNCNDAIQPLVDSSPAKWLGFAIRRRDDELRLWPTSHRWTSLKHRLERAHFEPNAPLVAVDIIEGWVSQTGPAFKCSLTRSRKFCNRIRRLSAEQGFDEPPTVGELEVTWERAYHRWLDEVAAAKSDG